MTDNKQVFRRISRSLNNKSHQVHNYKNVGVAYLIVRTEGVEHGLHIVYPTKMSEYSVRKVEGDPYHTEVERHEHVPNMVNLKMEE